MTEAIVTVSKNGLTLSVQGHAGFSSAGNDIVCAAASMLACTAAESFFRLQSEQACRVTQLEQSSGKFFLSLTANDACFPVCLLLLRSIYSGYSLLEKSYPQFVRTSWQGRTFEPNMLPCRKDTPERRQQTRRKDGSRHAGKTAEKE